MNMAHVCKVDSTHTHHGYFSKEYEVLPVGGTPLTDEEWRMVDRVVGIWKDRVGGA